MKKTLLPALLLAFCLASPLTFTACGSSPPPFLNSESLEELDGSVALPESSSEIEALPEESSSNEEETPAETPPAVEILPTTPVISQAEYIKTTGKSVNIRSGAGTSFSVLGSADEGGMYALTGKSGSWYKTYYRGKVAYISASYATVFSIEKTENEVENVIEEGYKLLGIPYVYGAVRLHDGNGKMIAGFTAQKFDCSSLVQYIFYRGAGKLLGVNTRVQVKQGTYVKKSDLQRGDCIFFTNDERQYNTGIERVGHVALYLGDDYILHTSSDYARIEKISAKRWSFYIEARRFL